MDSSIYFDLLRDIDKNLRRRGMKLSEKAREVFAATFQKSLELNCDLFSDAFLYGLLRSNSIAVPVFENLGINLLGLRNSSVASLTSSPGDPWYDSEAWESARTSEMAYGNMLRFEDWFFDSGARAEEYELFLHNEWLLGRCIALARTAKRTTIQSSDILRALIIQSLRTLQRDGYSAHDIDVIQKGIIPRGESEIFGSAFHELINSRGITFEKIENEIKRLHHFEPFIEQIQFCMHIEQDKITFAPLNFLNTYGILDDASAKGGRIYLANVQKPLQLPLFFQEEIEELNWLINKPNVIEDDLQRFFEAHQHFLLGSDYKNLHSQVVLTDNTEHEMIPDFFVERIGTNYSDIIDLKKPNEKLIVGSENRRGFSANLSSALNQLREYRNFFEIPNNRDAFYNRYGFRAYRPKIMVIMGRSRDFYNEIERTQILDEYKHVQVMTYDDILERARRHQLLLK
jgi:hypothetical protein